MSTSHSWRFLVLYLVAIVVFACLFSTVPFNECGPLEFGDAFYFSAVTITTLGYGDISPTMPWGKSFAALEAVCGVVIIGFFLIDLANGISSSAEVRRIQSQKDKLSHHYLTFKKRILGNFVWVLNENGAVEYDRLSVCTLMEPPVCGLMEPPKTVFLPPSDRVIIDAF